MVSYILLLEIKKGKLKITTNLLKKISNVKSVASNKINNNIAIFIELNKLGELHNFISKKLGKIGWIQKIESEIVIKKIIK